MTTWNLFILLNEEAKFVNGDGPLQGYCAAALGEIKIMFMRHTTKTKILTEILNSEFGTSVVYYGIFQKKSPMEPSMELL